MAVMSRRSSPTPYWAYVRRLVCFESYGRLAHSVSYGWPEPFFLAHVHVESYFCWLDPESAPVMMQMVDVGELPALLLAKNGQVVERLPGLERSFTTEGVAFELAQQGMVDFEDGTKYARPAGGCTTATANTGGAISDHSDDDISD